MQSIIATAHEESIYRPVMAKLIQVRPITKLEKLFTLQLPGGRSLGNKPGQFVEVSLLGIGEAPISVSSPPSPENTFEMCVRAVGTVTNKLHTLNEGDDILFRGPFGHGFDQAIMDRMAGKHLLFIGGGIGYVPLRSLINKVLKETEKYARVSILFGCKSPAERL